MKTKLTKAEPKSALRGVRQLFCTIPCLGTFILICFSASAQNLFVSSDAGRNIYEFTPNGVRSTFASGVAGPLAFDKRGNLFVTADHIYKFTPSGARTTFASFPDGWPAACDNAGNLFVATGETDLYEFPINGSGKVYKFTSTGARTTFASGLDLPTALAFDSAGNLFVANVHTVERDRTFNGDIYKFTPSGVRTTFASGPTNPEALAFNNGGNLFVSDPGPGSGAIYKFTPSGVRSIFAGGFSWAGSLACDSAGNLFVADSPAHAIYKITPTGARSTFAATDGVNLLAFQPALISAPGQLQNISTRAFGQTGDNVMIGGFIITGSGQKKVILRAIGPSLINYGIPNPLQNPMLELHDHTGAVIASNDNWMDAPNKQEIIDSGLAPSNNLESAILMSLSPGAYTAILRGVNNGVGVALVEGYDLDLGAGSKLGNMSTRALVQTGDDVMIAGLIITGDEPKRVIVRAIGPSLVNYGVSNPLQDTTLELHDGNGAVMVFNDNWRDTQQGQIEATGLGPTNDAESAIVQTLAPGNYTAIVRGKNNTMGVALVEVYGLN
jgi:sugar lactone lactonase YvrE